MKQDYYGIFLGLIRKSSIPMLAEKSGVAVSTIRNWLHGRATPSILNFEAVANALGYKVVLEKKTPDLWNI